MSFLTTGPTSLNSWRSDHMTISPRIQALVELGPLPSTEEAIADGARLDEFEKRLHVITSPVSDDEACALLGLFGPDECFGLAWTLLHLIESAPNWPIENILNSFEGLWPERMKERVQRKSQLR
jgi:hypothetical protein